MGIQVVCNQCEHFMLYEHWYTNMGFVERTSCVALRSIEGVPRQVRSRRTQRECHCIVMHFRLLIIVEAD